MSLSAIILACSLYSASSYVSPSVGSKRVPRVKPVYENFGLTIAEDPAENTPKEIFGEAAYKSFVQSYNPEGLIVGGPKYNIIERLRQLKLLTVTAESGLLEALEEKGVTLSALEKLLPLADDLNLLPLLVSNRDLALNTLAPLAIEPASALLPLVVSILKTPPTTFLAAGLVLAGAGAYEVLDGVTLAAPLVLLGLPLIALGGVLSGSVSLPSLPSGSSFASSPIAFDSAVSGRRRATIRITKNGPVTIKDPLNFASATKPAAAKSVPVSSPVKPFAASSKSVAASSNAVKVDAAAPVQRVRKTVKVNVK